MGVITDFFLATTADVARVLNGWQLPPHPERCPPNSQNDQLSNVEPVVFSNRTHWAHSPKPNPNANPAPKIDSLPNVQCNGMLPDKLALLFATLTEIPPELAQDLISYGYLTGPPEPEVTVQRLPLALTSALANANGADLTRAARTLEDDDVDRWGSGVGGKATELATVLGRIQALAKHGLSIQADLFIWTCT